LSAVGSRIARRALYLAAVNAVRRSAEWRTIYLRKRAQGKSAKQALIVVAVKLLHTLDAMLKHRRPYNPSRLLVGHRDDRALISHGMSRWMKDGWRGV
jgi:transposase